MDEDYLELKAWLDETRDVPLEAMDAFFEMCIRDRVRALLPVVCAYTFARSIPSAFRTKIMDMMEGQIIFSSMLKIVWVLCLIDERRW